MIYKLCKVKGIYYFALAFLFFSSHAGAGLETQRREASALFDGNLASADLLTLPEFKDDYARLRFVEEMRQVMSSGKWNGSVPETRHFKFRHSPGGWTAQAQNVGLEGFLWTKLELENKYGADKFIHHLNDYFTYLDGLLEPVSWTGELRQALRDLANSDMDAYSKNARLNAILENYVAGLRENMEKYDSASWIKSARIYELFPRAYNIAGRRSAGGFKSPSDPEKTLFFRDFRPSDFEVIKRMGFDTVWPMGIFPIGERGQTGTGGGSPYSISDHSTVNPDLGTEEDFRNFVRMAHQAGLRVIVDFVANHTSLDSKLLADNPDYFISFQYDEQCPRDGYFDYRWRGKKYCVHYGGFEYGGGISTWIDTAQINYSNQALRNRLTAIVRGWVEKFDVDGFRVDMAHLDLNNVFSRTWRKSMPYEEFYREMIREVKFVKPSTAFIAEAYAFQEDLSACGFDAIYSKYETGRPEGQTGWYETTASGNASQQMSSVNRQAFLAWQMGGADSVVFVGNHDEPAPEKIYGERLPAALMATMLMPTAVMVYSGAEIGYDASVPTEHKPLPFSVPVKIDWDGGNPWVKSVYQSVLSESARVREELGDYDIKPIWHSGASNWIGYELISDTGGRKAFFANVSYQNAYVNSPEHGAGFSLQPGEYRIIDL